jgi:NAD dependent epimerase/dehydratase family enzyme
VLGSIRVLPKRAQETGYRFEHPELEAAVRDLTR